MRIYADKLAAQLHTGLAPIYLVAGDEPLLVAESCAAVRTAAEAQGYGEREVVTGTVCSRSCTRPRSFLPAA